jgi:hypothetical protein
VPTWDRGQHSRSTEPSRENKAGVCSRPAQNLSLAPPSKAPAALTTLRSSAFIPCSSFLACGFESRNSLACPAFAEHPCLDRGNHVGSTAERRASK